MFRKSQIIHLMSSQQKFHKNYVVNNYSIKKNEFSKTQVLINSISNTIMIIVMMINLIIQCIMIDIIKF